MGLFAGFQFRRMVDCAINLGLFVASVWPPCGSAWSETYVSYRRVLACGSPFQVRSTAFATFGAGALISAFCGIHIINMMNDVSR
jgi:hypothetical protein